MSTAHAPEQQQTLVTLAAPLVVWTAHFVFAYGFSAIVCAKGAPLLVLRIGIAAATAAALALVARMGMKRGERAGERGFLSFVTKLIAGLAAVAILYSALVFVLIRDCK